MKQISRIISTYSADTFGVCSALFELGGMIIMHDASGCNSTYSTHDEPRWTSMDSMVYISALSEMEAIMGDDEKLISDIEAAAKDLKPKFIAIAGTPIPTMAGFDFKSVASVIEKRTGIPTFGFPTTGMNTYISGASMAFCKIAERIIKKDCPKSKNQSVNILGLTPLDFSINGEDKSIADFIVKSGYTVNARWAMKAELEELKNTLSASVNIVVSQTGLCLAKYLYEEYKMPYVAGIPVQGETEKRIALALKKAIDTGENIIVKSELFNSDDIAIIGEAVMSVSIAEEIYARTGNNPKVICMTGANSELLRHCDDFADCEDDIIFALKDAKIVIADPMFQPVCDKNAKFIRLPHEAFSGRIYRSEISDIVSDFNKIMKEVEKNENI